MFEFLGLSEDIPTVGLREYLKKMKSLKNSKVAGRTAGQHGLAEFDSRNGGTVSGAMNGDGGRSLASSQKSSSSVAKSSIAGGAASVSNASDSNKSKPSN